MGKRERKLYREEEIMQTEKSAGGVVIMQQDQEWLVLLMKVGNYRMFPKGNIEDGESFIETAEREIEEETGVKNLHYVMPLPDVNYQIKRTVRMDKTVHFFLFLSFTPQELKPQTQEHIDEVFWLPLEEAISTISYPESYKILLLKAKEWIEHHS